MAAKMKHSLLVLLGATFISSIADAQTCTAGSTDTVQGTSTPVSAIYAHRGTEDASCSGTVYAWNYCYYDQNNASNLEVAFGVFSFANNVYTLREGSYHLLHLDTRETTFTCDTLALDPSEYFDIQEGDRVGACLNRNGSVDYLDILKDTDNQQISHVWSASGGGCAISDMMNSPTLTGASHRSNLLLHLFVNINIDECALSDDDCSQYATCSDIIGGDNSFQCTCNIGFSGDGTTCTDINECESGTNRCSENATCTNEIGDYTCSCLPGFTGDGIFCDDINECETGSNNCGQNAECINTVGSYICSCSSGFTGDGVTCNNIDECVDGMHDCASQAICSDTEGSFMCRCDDGYTGDGKTCNDINECSSEPGPCDPNADCNNIQGGYTCQCSTSFTGDGLLCQREEQGNLGGSGSSLSVVVGVLGFISGAAIIIIIIIIVIFVIKRHLSSKSKDLKNTDGMDNMMYGDTGEGNIHFSGATNAIYDYPAPNEIYDYPTDDVYEYPTPLSETLKKSKDETTLNLEVYSAVDFKEIVNISENLSSVSFHKGGIVSFNDYEVAINDYVEAASDYEMPYYTPASHKGELYSQLRQQNIKAIPKNEIELAERLGGGEFGDVVKGNWKSVDYSVDVALKTLSGDLGEDGYTKLLQEAAIMSQFKHPNVVKLYGVVDDDIQSMLVLELLGRGDLREVLLSMRPDPGELVSPQTPMLLLNYCQQIATGLQYLSRKNFVHRDLAARNILISNNNTCKIGDFGMARNLLEDDYYVSNGGKIPLKWTAPEALVYRRYTTASDVWSYGCVLYEIWSLGHKPYESISNQETIEQVEAGYRLPPPPGCPYSIYSNMIHCWHPEASSRPIADEIVLALMENEETVLNVPEDAATNQHASTLGAPLEAGKDMYKELQLTYSSS